MPSKSTPPMPVVSPILSLAEAATALDMPDDTVRLLVKRGLVTYLSFSRKIQFLRTDIDEAVANRENLLAMLHGAQQQDWRIDAFERDTITAGELAQFLRVGVHDVRELLNFGDAKSVTKEFLWHIFVAGCDDRFATLHKVSQRVATNARLRAFRISKARRQQIRARDCDSCRYCGQPQTEIVLDHVIPKAQGGTNQPNNLVVSCSACNTRKGNRMPHEAGMRLLPAGMHLTTAPIVGRVRTVAKTRYPNLVEQVFQSP